MTSRFLSSVLLLAGVAVCGAAPAIIVPSIVSSANENAFSGQGFTFLTNNSGMTPAVSSGATLATAQSAVHNYGGFTESWVTVDSTGDYFATGTGLTAKPTIVFDLGQTTVLADIILWQYQNDGGGGPNTGNQTRSLELRFNTAAQGFASFTGSATTLTLKPVTDGDGVSGNDLAGVNGAQTFALSGSFRYVQLTVTDNYRDFQGITGGGDRAGLGEVRFFGEAVPEPASAGLLVLAGLLLGRRRR